MAHPVDIQVGARLRRFRKEASMSQQDLGDQLGLTFQQVQKYERGTNRVSASKLFEAASCLGVKVQDFFEGLGPEVSTNAVSESLLADDPTFRKLVRIYRAQKTEAERQRLVDAAEVVGRPL